MSKTQFLELMRQSRLWITSIIFPVIGIAILAYAKIPKFRNWVDRKILNKVFK